MTASVTHATTAVGTDAGTGEIHKAQWNAGHSVSGVSLEGHDHDGSPDAKLAQANTHESPDTDSGTSALHHTLGTGANQAAAGTDSRLSNQRNPNDHTHAAGSGDGGVLSSPEVSAKILMDNQGGDPSSPASGKILVYTKAAGLFIKTSGGTVVGPMVDATGAGGLTNGTPGLTLGTTNVAGAASTGIATDATIALFDATTPANVGTAATGSAAFAAHRDHIHGTGAGTPSTQAFGDAAATGTGPAAAMTDHKHAMPANPFPAGTSFPGGPSTNDRYFRTDLGLGFYYDGTRWLTTTEYVQTIGERTYSASANNRLTMDVDYDMWITRINGVMIAGSLSGSAYWTAQLRKGTPADSFSNVGTALSIISGTSSNWLARTQAIAALFDRATYSAIDLLVTKVSTPGNLTAAFLVYYRLVGT